MQRKSIAVDMDNVIADVATHFIDWYERDYGVRIDRQSLAGVPEMEAFPHNAVSKFVYTPGFFRTVPVMPGAQDAVKKLMDNFEVFVVSAAMEFPQSLPEKYEWLSEHFPFISWKNIVFCGDKSIIATDYLIDDYSKNLDSFTGKALLFTAGHNMNVTHHQRVNDWNAVLRFIENAGAIV